ncbi:MAG: hypothetical protein DRH97_00140 [Chloroflexi bacterium]|nr:MAG: hypothetical protein DRH97_00140 [Chloroflexota bacterium]
MNYGAIQKGKPYDNGSFTVAQVSYLGQIKEVPHVTPYGFFSMPPVGSAWVVIPLRGNDNDMVGFGNDYKNRPTDLKEGDVCLFSTVSKAKLVLRATGDFELIGTKDGFITVPENLTIRAKNANIIATEMITMTAPNLVINANTVINGSLTVIGTIIGNIIQSLGALFWDIDQSVDAHTHNSGTVGPPDNQ